MSGHCLFIIWIHSVAACFFSAFICSFSSFVFSLSLFFSSWISMTEKLWVPASTFTSKTASRTFPFQWRRCVVVLRMVALHASLHVVLWLTAELLAGRCWLGPWSQEVGGGETISNAALSSQGLVCTQMGNHLNWQYPLLAPSVRYPRMVWGCVCALA